MKVSNRISFLSLVILIMLTSCISEPEDDGSLDYLIDEELVIPGHFIEDYNVDSWKEHDFILHSVVDIFAHKWQYEKFQFNYSTLITELELHFDFPRTFIKPDDIYGFKDPEDYSTLVTNQDTANLSDEEFTELLSQLSLSSGESESEISVLPRSSHKAAHLIDRKLFISAIDFQDENTAVIYVKEYKTIYRDDVLELGLDTIIYDYWLLYKIDRESIYSHKKWRHDGYLEDLDTNIIDMYQNKLKVDMYDITDSIVHAMK